jgi:hypothetical protein
MPAITSITVTVRGRVAPGTTSLTAGGTPVIINPDRSWSVPVVVSAGGTVLDLTSTHANGRTAVRTILVDGMPSSPAPVAG